MTDMFEFKRILVPIDFSECSERALGFALSLAVRFDAELFLMYVKDSRPGSRTYDDNVETRREVDAIERDEAALREIWGRVSGAVAAATGLPGLPDRVRHLRVAAGSPADEIVRAAEDAAVDLIVMGTHGREGIKAMFVGSTTEQVVNRATCAVMAVKPEGYPYLRD